MQEESPMPAEEPVFDYHFAAGRNAAEFPFELNANKPYVPVRVNDGRPGWFILDTGSVSVAIDSELAQTLELTLGETFESTGAGEGSLSGATGAGVALALPGLDLSTGSIDIFPINQAIGFSEGRRVDGLLGYEFFARLVVVLDYAARRVRVHDPRAFAPPRTDPPAGAITLPLDITRGHPFVSAELV